MRSPESGLSVLIPLAVLLLVAGCIGTVDEGTEARDEEDLGTAVTPSQPPEVDTEGSSRTDETSQLVQAPADFTRTADASANVTTRLPQTGVDPSEDGSSTVERQEYDFGYTVVNETYHGPAYKAKIAGSVTYPVDGETSPIIVLVHGRHGTCEIPTGTRVLGTPECPEAPPAMEPVPSYQGYRYLADTLASHGFVVVSIDANDINDQDLVGITAPAPEPVGERQVSESGIQPRAQLILRTLDRFEEVDAGEDPGAPIADNGALVDALQGRLAMDEIGLVGHSRGGDGVSHAVEYNEDRLQGEPHDLSAVFAIAPTDYLDTSTPGVAYATLLPYCDGDVYTLAGAHTYDRTRYLDDAGPLYQYVAMGSNHVYYNTVWTGYFDDADAFDDPFCGEPRADGGGQLSVEGQRRHGEALVDAFLRSHLGGEERFEPFLKGRTLTPPAACPADAWPCVGLLHTSYHPSADQRLVVASIEDGLGANDLGGEIRLEGNLTAEVCTPPDCPTEVDRQLATQAHLAWTGPGRMAFEVPEDHADLAAYDWLSLRVGTNLDQDANEDRARQDVSIALVDRDGTTQRVSADRFGHSVFVPPGSDDTGRVSGDVTLNAVRIPLDAFEDVDLDRVAEVAIVTDRTPSGSIQVNDVMLQR